LRWRRIPSLALLLSFAFGAKVALSGESHNGHYKTRLAVMQPAKKHSRLPASQIPGPR